MLFIKQIICLCILVGLMAQIKWSLAQNTIGGNKFKFFLTVGILLGSWWAYHELGWGGWWFWDPVENASLMPWILATAIEFLNGTMF